MIQGKFRKRRAEKERVFITGGRSGRGVQWIGVVSYNKLVSNSMKITTPCFHCTPLCRMQKEQYHCHCNTEIITVNTILCIYIYIYIYTCITNMFTHTLLILYMMNTQTRLGRAPATSEEEPGMAVSAAIIICKDMVLRNLIRQVLICLMLGCLFVDLTLGRDFRPGRPMSCQTMCYMIGDFTFCHIASYQATSDCYVLSHNII